MQSQNYNVIATYAANGDVVVMQDQLTRTGDAARPAYAPRVPRLGAVHRSIAARHRPARQCAGLATEPAALAIAADRRVMLGHCLVAQRAFGVARVVALGLAGGGHECRANTQNSADLSSAGLRSKTAPKGRYMPAVYEVDEKGNEALMNTTVIDGNS